MKRRVLSFIIALALCLDLCPVWGFAAYAETGDGLCPHHPAHTDACGYALPVLEQECAHNHDAGCYTAETDCIHGHTAGCCPDPEGEGAVLCDHSCTEDSGCVTYTLSCLHAHDGACGYVPGNPGAPCTFVCRICPIEELIGRLPGSVTAYNRGQVQAQLNEILDLYTQLTGDEQQQVDISPCVSLREQLDGAGTAVPGDISGSSGHTMIANEERTVSWVASASVVFNTAGHTLTLTSGAAMGTSAIQVTPAGALTLTGRGTITSQRGAGVEVQSGGSLYITEEGMTITGLTYALHIASGATVQLSPGTYTGKTAAIYMEDGDYSALLADGYAYFDANGNPILPSDVAAATKITVGQCTAHPDKTHAHAPGTTTHTWTCPHCGMTGTEPCTFTFDTTTGTGTCGLCSSALTIAVDEAGLSSLVYGGTVKPEDVEITFTLADGTEPALVRDTDYRAEYLIHQDAGQVTVTVTGITFGGTFTRLYTVTRQPVLAWDTSVRPVPIAVDYDGSPVEAGELPSVIINIKDGEGLRDKLSYSYRPQTGSAYTGGLPVNAGTYDVTVSLPAMPDFEGAVSEPITLTVNKIDPLATAPVATRPVFDRSSQELVTAGALRDVAVRDGVEILFARNEAGPYDAAIPTGINAGTDYHVWYRVEGTENYNPVGPLEIMDVEIRRKPITPVVELSEYTYLYDSGYKEPAVTVKDEDHVTVLLNTEYRVEYRDNRDVGTAKVVVTDMPGGNYDITQVEVPFKITLRTQETLSITQQPNTVTYGDQFTLGTIGGSGSGAVTWKITGGEDVAEVNPDSGQVTITGTGSATVQATKSGRDPADNKVNYSDATATWTIVAAKKPVVATVTADDKPYDGDANATVHAVVEEGVLAGDEIKIEGLTGTFSDENAGVDKTVTVDTTNTTITGRNSEHYAVSWSATTVRATIRKAVVEITAPPVTATLTYNGTAQELIDAGAVVNTAGVEVEYALREEGPYSTDFPKGVNAGDYTVWYRVRETDNYTGLPPVSIPAAIARKPVTPVITLDKDSFVYDGNPKEPGVTLNEDNAGGPLIPADEYTVAYSNHINVTAAATVTVTAKPDGNYTFAPVDKTFAITKEQARVLTAPTAVEPLTYNTRAQKLVSAGVWTGGTMVYSVDDENGAYEETIPVKTDAGSYTVYYMVRGDGNHSDSEVGSVTVLIDPRVVNNPTIDLTLTDPDGNPVNSYTYDGDAKEPHVEVKDGSTVIDATEYNIVYSDNTDAGRATVSITDRPNGNYTVTGLATFVIQRASIVFHPEPKAADIAYNGSPQELLLPGTTSGGTVQYALNSPTGEYRDAIPTATEAGEYTVYYKVTGDKNHIDFPITPVPVTIRRKPLTAVTIELTPDSFEYDGTVKMPAVTVRDGETVLPEKEYLWTCSEPAPTDQGTYTVTVTDKAGGNYDLTGVTGSAAEAAFTIGRTAQAELVIENIPAVTSYGDAFRLTVSGGSGNGAVSWDATGPAVVDADGNVRITGVGDVTIMVKKAADTNYLAAGTQWTFTAAPRPVTASVTVADRVYDGTTAATVTAAGITTLAGDTVTIEPTSITAAFDTPSAGTGKTVALDTSGVQVTGADAAKYDISYPDTVKADITRAAATITGAPEAIAPLTYNREPQALVTAGTTSVGFLVYSLDGTDFSPEIPTGTDAGEYTVHYKVEETADYTGATGGTIPVTIAPRTITPRIELSETSYTYNGTTKNPKITVRDGNTVIEEEQYAVTWANADPLVTDGMLTAAGTYTATIKSVDNGNYSFTTTATVKIIAATQDALKITGKPAHVCYGDTITTLDTSGGAGNGTVTWEITSGSTGSFFEPGTSKLTVRDTGNITVTATRRVPNYGDVSDTWTFTVEPKQVEAVVKVAAKPYDGTAAVADTTITAAVKPGDLVDPADGFTLSGLKGTYDTASAGTGKTVTLDDTGATRMDGGKKYVVSYPATVTGDITQKNVTVTVTLSGDGLQTDTSVTPPAYSYAYDGAPKTPAVTVTAEDGAVLTAGDYGVSYSGNTNFGTATVTVTAKADGNYTFTDEKVNFAIRKAGAVLTSNPKANDLTYEKGTEQELVSVGTAAGGTVVYALKGAAEPADADYSETIPRGEDAGVYTVYYKVRGDGNHDDTAPGQVSVTIRPKQITPVIELSPASYEYDGTPREPAVTVRDGNDVIAGSEYTVSCRDNINAGTATVTVIDNNGGNYIVNGTASFEITKKAPAFTPPAVKPGLMYNGELQELVTAGVCNEGAVYYSVNGGSYSTAIPVASAVGKYAISYKVVGDANHSDKDPVDLVEVEIAKNTVTNPTISLSSDTFRYNGNQQQPTVTVYDGGSRLIPNHEYTVTFTGGNMVDAGTYTVTVTTPDASNYVINGNNTREFKIVPADQETLSITGTKAQVCYGEVIQLGTTGGTGSGTVTWTVTGSGTINSSIHNGLLTVKDVNTPITVTATRSRDNYGDVSATWEFTAAKKPVEAVVTAADRDYADGNTAATVSASVPESKLAAGDSITITGLTGTFDDANAGTEKKVTVNSAGALISGTNWEKYDITFPAATTASIRPVPATATAPTAMTGLIYDAGQAQELLDRSAPGTATGGDMVYSLNDRDYTSVIPKAGDAGSYTVYYRVRGDRNHTDSETGTVPVEIARQTVTPQIELSPPGATYDGTVKRPENIIVRDDANNVIPDSEYIVGYNPATNWKDVGDHKVTVENITGGNYIIMPADATFSITATAQNPLEIVNRPGRVYYGDTFTLSATGGSGSEAVTWTSSDETIAEVDANGFVTIKGTGSATITATRAGGLNYEEATATCLLKALKKPITAIVTAEDRMYVQGDKRATIHVAWEKDALVGKDRINTDALVGEFDDDSVGTDKTVKITGNPASDETSAKYDITVPPTTTASILKAEAVAPNVGAVPNLVYNRSAQTLVSGGNAGTTLYSTARDGVYSTGVPEGTGAGTYTVWYMEKGDANHNDSAPQSLQVTISPRTLTADATNVTLSGNDLQTENTAGAVVYYYAYDGTDRTPTVTVMDGGAVVPAGEYTVTYSGNKNTGTATVTITDNQDGNYAVSGSVSFEIRRGNAQLNSSPVARVLTYTGAEQELVTAGSATGGTVVYALKGTAEPADADYSETIPRGKDAGDYTVYYRVKGDANHDDNLTAGSVTVAIHPKTVVSPVITVTGGPYPYTGSEQIPDEDEVEVKDGVTIIPPGEYTLSCRDNVNAGTATVVVTNANGGNYIVNGTGTFTIAKADVPAPTAPTGRTDLPYNGEMQELVTAGSATGGTMVYSLEENGEYTPAIPTAKEVKDYTVWYRVKGDGNHNDSAAASVSASIVVNNVTAPIIQVTPAQATYNGEKQQPTVTVRDGSFVIDGSGYTVAYTDSEGNAVTELIDVGTYNLTITGNGTGYSFTAAAQFEILPADQTPLTITGTQEEVCYGDTIQLVATGGNGTVEWKVDNGSVATITGGLLKITGSGASVTVTATSRKPGYADRTATWTFYADKKPVTAVVTAVQKPYDGTTDAVVTAALQSSDLADGDSIAITLSGSFEDSNAGTDKKVNVDSSSPTFSADSTGYDNYNITYPATTTASILKADIDPADVTAPTPATNPEYTGLPLPLIAAAGSAEGGSMEYSLDNITYSAALPTGTGAGDYDVWYRVKGDGNHNDIAPKKLTATGKVTIARQTVAADDLVIEFNPTGASYDGREHRPAVTVKDKNKRVIPDSEYMVDYGTTDWTAATSATVQHKVKVTNRDGGNYDIAGKEQEFIILVAGQSPLSITNKPGRVQYGDSFTLSATGGSGTGKLVWDITNDGVAQIDQNGTVKVLKSGSATVTVKREADGGYGETTDTWSFSAEKKVVRPGVTAKDKEYDAKDTADLVITWREGDLLDADTGTIRLEDVLDGRFDSADAGTGKTVHITGKAPDDERYDIRIPATTTASITPKAASVEGSTPDTLTYDGSAQDLVSGLTAKNGTLAYSRNGSYYTLSVPRETGAGTYSVWYRAQASGNYTDSPAVGVEVTIRPKEVTNPGITLSGSGLKQEADGTYYCEYDGTAKTPDVVVLDGTKEIPASEYTVRYGSNTAAGSATVTISNADGGNYTISTRTVSFTIRAGAPSLTSAPEPRDLTYSGKQQPLVTAGTAANGRIMYCLDDPEGEYKTTIPTAKDADSYYVWYKVKSTDGASETDPDCVEVEISPKPVTPTILLEGQYSYSTPYTGSAIRPAVTVKVSGQVLDDNYDVSYSKNTSVGTAEVIVESTNGNYEFFKVVTFEITKGKAVFSTQPQIRTGLVYNGKEQKLVTAGASANGPVLYSTDNFTFSPVIPVGIEKGSYPVYARVQGSSIYEESDLWTGVVEIGQNVVSHPKVTLSQNSFNYTGSPLTPTVTVTDDSDRIIPASEYTVMYSDNIEVGKGRVTITGKGDNYSFSATAEFAIVGADQSLLTITGKKDTVYYGDTLSLGTSGGSGSGAVTWSATGPVSETGAGQYRVNSSGSVTITATKAAVDGYGAATDTWTFTARAKPVIAVVTAAGKPYDGSTTATLTVTISSGLVSGDSIPTNTEDGVRAQGQFTDETVGTGKTVVITGLTVPADVSAKYDISCNSTTTASITPKPATVTDAPVRARGLTYNGSSQPLLASGGTADGGKLMYSLDGRDYTYTIPTGTDAKTYTVWYKVEAADENHRDSAAVMLGDVEIGVNTDRLTVTCTPGTVKYDGTEKTPTVVVTDSAGCIIPKSEYTVTFEPGSLIAAGTYKVTVTDKQGGNYSFDTPVTRENAFEIVAADQNPLSVISSETAAYYGDTIRLTATGGSGSGAIVWSIQTAGNPGVAKVTQTNGNNCVVTVEGTGGFTVEAYREAGDGYGRSNTDSVVFEAKRKPVTPVVTASDKPYDGNTSATLKAAWPDGALVGSDTIELTVDGEFETKDAGTNKRVVITTHTAAGAGADKYAITWPDSTTASISKVDAKLVSAPAGINEPFDGSEKELVRGGATLNDIGEIVYSLEQNGAYSERVPTATGAGTYLVWYKVADSVNYTGIPAASVRAEITQATPDISRPPVANSGTVGQKLSEIGFMDGGSTSVSGKFDWANGDEVIVADKTQYDVIFTPDDASNYKAVTIQIPVTIAPAADSPVIDDMPFTDVAAAPSTGPVRDPAANAAGAPMQTTIQDGTASAVVSSAEGEKLVKEAVENQSQNIVIKPEITGDVTRVQVSIPASTVSRIRNGTDAALTVSAPMADVTIPQTALDTLSGAGGDVSVMTGQVDRTVVLTLTAGGEKVESVPGGVTLTVPAEEAGPGTVAVLVHEDGSRETIRKSVAEDGRIRIPLSGSAAVEIVDNGREFADVPPESWAADAAAFVSARELFGGTSETTFSPDEPMSRGMLATVLYRLEGSPSQDAASKFSDVSDDAWYAPGIAWATGNGIAGGYGDGQFGPDDSITREQFAVMLWKYAGSPEVSDQTLDFTDADQASSYARKALRWAVENGVMSGDGSGQLAPGATATRAEAAQMLKNFMESI